ncbi:hypothetical protein Glove_85g28 [Diversispora epigaea]|uniref:Uncharacterized protein n=1 Tax=Diversispora epigaea TaxID=1348612 RepID=A0A397JDZ3_9GLOM|nr:hypothetical protein Glove_85g28 [Diversispora epigaea]
MSTSTQNIDQVSTEVKSSKPTWQDIEKAILVILKAGIFCKKPKNKGFMSRYKKQLDELRGSENPEMYIYEKAIENFPNEEAYNQTIEDHEGYYKKDPRIQKAIKTYYILCYTIVKDTFATEEEIEEELDSWINS